MKTLNLVITVTYEETDNNTQSEALEANVINAIKAELYSAYMNGFDDNTFVVSRIDVDKECIY